MTEDKTVLPLAESIDALRRELTEAIRTGESEELQFALGTVELELQVEAKREGTGAAGIVFGVVSLGGKGSRSSGSTHTLRLTLTPVRVGADDHERHDVLVASDLEPRP